MIPPMHLPSRPETEIRMREATVAEMIDFADVDPDHEEELSTIFLRTVQTGDSPADPRAWTGEDRRLALWWNWIHTAKNDDTTIPMSYPCKCGERHTFLFDARELANEYRRLNGAAEREFEHGGRAVVVRPLVGLDLEALELMRIAADEAERTEGARSAGYRRALAEFEIEELLRSFSFRGADENAREAKREWVLAMGASEFAAFAREVRDRIDDMAHGLPMESDRGRLYLRIPPHQCPRREEVRTPLRLRFRNIDYIPGIHGRGMADGVE